VVSFPKEPVFVYIIRKFYMKQALSVTQNIDVFSSVSIGTWIHKKKDGSETRPNDYLVIHQGLEP
jgi:hypothetical protein